jgi:hypothetical protein
MGSGIAQASFEINWNFSYNNKNLI